MWKEIGRNILLGRNDYQILVKTQFDKNFSDVQTYRLKKCSHICPAAVSETRQTLVQIIEVEFLSLGKDYALGLSQL